MPRPNKKNIAARAAAPLQNVTLRERLATRSLQQVEVPFLVVDPATIEKWRKELEAIVPEALTWMKTALKATKIERNAGAKVAICRTAFEMLNILKPAPSFAAQLVHEKTREMTTDREGLALELLRGLDPEKRQALLEMSMEPPPPDQAPPLALIDVQAAAGEPDEAAADAFDEEDPFA